MIYINRGKGRKRERESEREREIERGREREREREREGKREHLELCINNYFHLIYILVDFVYHHWECTSINHPLSYPLQSLDGINHLDKGYFISCPFIDGNQIK